MSLGLIIFGRRGWALKVCPRPTEGECMIDKKPYLWTVFFVASLSLPLLSLPVRGESYDLRRVKGMETFAGSSGARELLGKNGFVVADPTFKQIFEPYIKSPEVEKSSENNPMGVALPSFVTTDSA